MLLRASFSASCRNKPFASANILKERQQGVRNMLVQSSSVSQLFLDMIPSLDGAHSVTYCCCCSLHCVCGHSQTR